MQLEALKAQFYSHFGEGAEPSIFFCPGRVNLIGEHIDYNGGWVFPSALDMGIWLAIRKHNGNYTALRSLNAFKPVDVALSDELRYNDAYGWANYPIGVAAFLINEGYTLSQYNMLFYGNLPDGAGLSSSAAIEVLTAYALLTVEGQRIDDKVWLATFCQKVENQFIGVKCGIMDQFSVAMGKKDHAVLLDCNSLQYEYVPVRLEAYSLVIMNTNKRRELADSKYNERRNECEKALEILKQYFLINNLCEADLGAVNKLIDDPVLKRRASHVINENQRVHKAVEVLKNGNIRYFGLLLNDSHRSLRDDYEVTGAELDAIVEAAQASPFCIGARMTGAGFGGCAIALVQTAHYQQFIQEVGDAYTQATGLKATFYQSQIGEGVHQLL